MTHPRIGDLTLLGKIGEGGMGHVFHARTSTGEECAVKLVHEASDRNAAIELDREVRAQARLVHPNISELRDVGTVSEHDDPPDGFGPGCAYMVMKLAEGSLADILPLQSWSAARAVLLQILDGLAYAHARSVIHRDLKPANVLIVSDGGPAPSIQLADFGISVVYEGAPGTDTSADLRRTSGTPAYMSPEQIHGAWQNFGPWSDLYALGCIAWELVCGRPPFIGRSIVETVQQHAKAPRPNLRPQFAIPAGLEEWVHRAMAVRPSQRFRRAVDAARELLSLQARIDEPAEEISAGFAVEETLEEIPAGFAVEETLEWTHTLAPLDAAGLSTTVVQEPLFDATTASGGPQTLFAERPPIPPTWRGRKSGYTPASAPALIALRPTPIVGRDDARDQMWAALRRARELDRPEIVLLAGPTGSGRTQLANWMAERGRELGVAGRLWANFGPGGAGLGGLVTQTFLLWGIEQHEYAETLALMIPRLEDDPFFDDDVQTLARLAGPSVGNRREEFVALRRLIARLGRINLPGLYLDDAGQSPEALAFVEFLSQSDGPACLVVASVDVSILDDPAAPPELIGLLQAECVTRVDVDILDEREHREFLEAIAPLNPSAIEQLTRASLGSPAFAIELLLDWLRGGLLAETDAGLELSTEAATMVERSANDVAIARVAQVVEHAPLAHDEAWKALEIAAILGEVVDMEHWARASGATDLDLLRQQIAREGVGHETPNGFVFANGLVRRALVERAINEGRYEEWHAACAEALGDPGDDPQKLRRVANHWVEAGQPQEALEHLLEASRAVGRSHGTRARLRLLEYRESLLDRLGAGETDPRRVVGQIHLRRCDVETHPHQALDLVEDLERRGLLATPDVAEQAMRLASMATRRLGRTEESLQYGRRSVEYARSHGDPTRLTRCLLFYAHDLTLVSRFDEANELLREVRANEQETVVQDAWRLAIEATLEEASGELDEARRLLRVAIEQATQERALALVRNFHSRLGELERRAGNAEAARTEYEVQRQLARRAEEAFELFVVDCNLALTEILAGNPEAARPALTAARDQGLWLPTVTRGLLACDVLAGDFEAARASLEQLPPSGDLQLTPDDPWLLEIAARNAADAGEITLARRCASRGAAEWRQLGRLEEAERCDGLATTVAE